MKTLFERVFNGSDEMFAKAEEEVNKIVAEVGRDAALTMPSTAYFLACIYAYIGKKVTTTGELQDALADVKAMMLREPRTPSIFQSGVGTAIAAEMIEACKLSQADDFVRSFPDGYDTYIEQGGTNVSGGQKQRLCIARALLKKPKILILDDSTSAVDTRTDALIREGFKSYIPETTKIIIAQRVASVQDADLILVMDGGAIAASGTHEELLRTSEIYREVYESQTNGGDENA